MSFIALGVTVPFFWSCQIEDMPLWGAEEGVAFTVSMDEVQTKASGDESAIADGSNIDILYYEVYGDDVRTDGAKPIYEGSLMDRNTEGDFVLEIQLVKNVKYHFLFWAQVDGKTHYDVTDLRMVKIDNYSDEKANDEDRAAFYAYKPITVTGSSDKNITVTLKRPFSQINFGTTTYDNTGEPLTVSQSKMIIPHIADTFNTLEGIGLGDNTVTFDYAATPNGKNDESKKLLKTNGTEYYWLGMNYLIVSGKKDNVTVYAYFMTNKGEVHITVPSVPVEMNYRTNIVGNLLTTNAVFNVVVDKGFDKPDYDRDDNGNEVELK